MKENKPKFNIAGEICASLPARLTFFQEFDGLCSIDYESCRFSRPYGKSILCTKDRRQTIKKRLTAET